MASRRHPGRTWLLVLSAAAMAVLSACGAIQTFPLPTAQGDTGGCRGVGLDGYKLAGSPTDPRVTWLVMASQGVRRDIVWPSGFHAVFSPQLAVVDPSGHTVMKEGDAVTGACVTGPDGVLGPEPLLMRP